MLVLVHVHVRQGTVRLFCCGGGVQTETEGNPQRAGDEERFIVREV